MCSLFNRFFFVHDNFIMTILREENVFYLVQIKYKKYSDVLEFYVSELRSTSKVNWKIFIHRYLMYGISNDQRRSQPPVPGGQEFHFPHFSSNFHHFFLFFLKFSTFLSSFWPSGGGGRLAHPGRP